MENKFFFFFLFTVCKLEQEKKIGEENKFIRFYKV